MTRSFWKVPSDMGIQLGNVVVYDESPQFLYVIAAEEERPDIAAVGTLLGKAVRELNAADQARFLRVEVERDVVLEAGQPAVTIRTQVKGADKRPTDLEIRTNIPAVIWMGDNVADYAP